MTNITTTMSAPEYFVFHGGSLLGQGRWSGPHATREDAEQSRQECVRSAGGSPTVVEVESISEEQR